VAGQVIVPARSGKAVRVGKGERVKLTNTHGSQVVDTWAFNATDPREFMSMEHTRVMLGKVNPKCGDELFSNRRRPLLNIIEDTSPGVHDTLRAACDAERYRLLGFEKHESCAENLVNAMLEHGCHLEHLPCPLNVFENCPVRADGGLTVVPPPVKAGQCITFKALMDVIVVFSACPMDVFPTNGADCIPKAVAYELV
jgi:uncharacterized protein